MSTLEDERRAMEAKTAALESKIQHLGEGELHAQTGG